MYAFLIRRSGTSEVKRVTFLLKLPHMNIEALFLSSFFYKNEAKLANAVHEVKTSLVKKRRASRIAPISRSFTTTEKYNISLGYRQLQNKISDYIQTS